MQDWKSHASRRTPHRKLRSSSVTVRKHRGRTFIHAKSLSQREEPRKILPSLFRNPFRKDPGPEANQRNFWDWASQTLGLVLLIVMLWFGGGTAYLGWSYFQKPVEEVRISGNKLLSAQEVLFLSRLRPGILLSELDPYQTASLIQQHPAVRRADVRREFPSRVHLKLHEHTPEVLVERNHPGSSGETGDHWLVTSERLVLQSVSTERVEGSEFRDLPRLFGLSDEGIRPGVEWNSLPLKRGMSFLMNFREWKNGGIPELSGNPEENTGMDLDSVTQRRLLLDLKDPMNLRMHWIFPSGMMNLADGLGRGSPSRKSSVVVNLGRKQYPQRLKRFGEILPQLIKEHPEMKSIDMRYPDRVTLVP